MFDSCFDAILSILKEYNGDGIGFDRLKNEALNIIPELNQTYEKKAFDPDGHPQSVTLADIMLPRVLEYMKLEGIIDYYQYSTDRFSGSPYESFFKSVFNNDALSIPFDINTYFHLTTHGDIVSLKYVCVRDLETRKHATDKEYELMNIAIDDLFFKNKLYFRPWIGHDYLEGINGKKVLMIGASRYCTYNKYCDCPHFSQCTDYKDDHYAEFFPDFDENCLMCHGLVEDGHLSDVNTLVIKQYLHECDEHPWNPKNQPDAYSIFDIAVLGKKDGISKVFSFNSSRLSWHHLAFANFISKMVDPTILKTKPYSENDAIKERSIKAIIDIIDITQPDLVITWGEIADRFLSTTFVKKNLSCVRLNHPCSDKWGYHNSFTRGSGIKRLDDLRAIINK